MVWLAVLGVPGREPNAEDMASSDWCSSLAGLSSLRLVDLDLNDLSEPCWSSASALGTFLGLFACRLLPPGCGTLSGSGPGGDMRNVLLDLKDPSSSLKVCLCSRFSGDRCKVLLDLIDPMSSREGALSGSSPTAGGDMRTVLLDLIESRSSNASSLSWTCSECLESGDIRTVLFDLIESFSVPISD